MRSTIKFLILCLNITIGLNALAQTTTDTNFQQRRTLAIQIFEATQAEQVMNQLLAQSTNNIKAMLESSSQGKKVPPELYEKLQKFSIRLSENFSKAMSQPGIKDELFGSIFNTYAELFTRNELEQVLAFYKSPIGKKFITEQANALPRVGPQIQQSVAKILMPIMSATAKEVGLEK